jgi:hypothetical protein
MDCATEIRKSRWVGERIARLGFLVGIGALHGHTVDIAIMRSSGTGPRFMKRGRVFYFLEDLQAWIAEQPRVQSSAQARLRGYCPD